MPRKLLILITMLCCGALPATVQAQSTADDSAPHCKYVKLSTLPVSFAAGTSSPEIDGSINSAPVRLLVDTGAYQTSLYRSRIEALDLPLRHLNAYAAGVGGEAAQYGVLLQELSIGAIHGGRRMFKVLDDGERKSRVSGLAGADFLRQPAHQFFPSAELRRRLPGLLESGCLGRAVRTDGDDRIKAVVFCGSEWAKTARHDRHRRLAHRDRPGGRCARRRHGVLARCDQGAGQSHRCRQTRT